MELEQMAERLRTQEMLMASAVGTIMGLEEDVDRLVDLNDQQNVINARLVNLITAMTEQIAELQESQKCQHNFNQEVNSNFRLVKNELCRCQKRPVMKCYDDYEDDDYHCGYAH